MAFEWTAVPGSSSGNYRGICCITDQICVHNIPLTWPTRVYNWCLLREICLLVLNYFIFLFIHHLSLTFTVSPPLSFHVAVCMNNICHVASPSLKVTLVNYWSGQMITVLTCMFSSTARLSFHVYALNSSLYSWRPSYDELLSIVIAGGVLVHLQRHEM